MPESKPRKIKLLFVITQGEFGGAQRYVFDLATHLNPPQSPLKIRREEKGGYEILVAMGKEKNGLGLRLEQSGINIFYLNRLIRNIHPANDLLAVMELKELIQRWQPDIIHLNSSKAGVIGSLAAHLAKNPNVVFTAHGFAFLEPHIFRSIYFWAEKLACAFRKKIITVSEFDRRAAINWKLCPPEKLITIHNGIDSPPRDPFGSAQGHLEPRRIGEEGLGEVNPLLVSPSRRGEKIVIGTIAHDYPTKDLATLRSAFEILKPEFPNLKLTIIGRTRLPARQGGESGEMDNAANSLSDFDIYVCSSIKEGFPYSVLEAMHAGLPIVSTHVGGIPEMLQLPPSPGDGEGLGERSKKFAGLLVPPQNPTALAAAIKKLLVNPQLAMELGERARKKVQEFSMEKMIAETEKVYQLLI